MIAIAAGEDKHYLVEYLHIDNADWLTFTDIREIAQQYCAATQYEHILIDLSFLQNEEEEILESLSGLYAISPANLILLACGCKPQELLALPEAFEATEGSEIFFLFSFISPANEKDVEAAMAEKADHTFFLPWCPSVMEWEPQMGKVFSKIFGGDKKP